MTATLERRTLFGIGTEFLALNERLDELTGEIADPALDAEFAASFADVETAEGVKLDRYVNWIRSLEMEASTARSEAEEYIARAQARENRVKWLKQRMKAYLEYTNRQKVQTATGRTLAIQANGGSVPVKLADGIDPATVPDDLVIVKRTVDTDAVRKALQAGRELPFATLGERGSHLRIR